MHADDWPRLIEQSLARVDQCVAEVLPLNLLSYVDQRDRTLPSLLLLAFYQWLGYSSNLVYARTIESVLDARGRLQALHDAAARRAGSPKSDLLKTPATYRKHWMDAAVEIAPDLFATAQDVDRSLRDAQAGEQYNIVRLVETLLDYVARRQAELKKPVRLMLVLDESGPWVGKDSGRLESIGALVEQCAVRGQGKLWVVVTTHSKMEEMYAEARVTKEDMLKIQERFCEWPSLTSENIERVLEDRLLRKTLPGTRAIRTEYTSRAGVLRGLGEQLTGSTRTLLAVTQDVLRAGRRAAYLNEPIGAMVSFDEIYANLAGDGEISPNVTVEIANLSKLAGATPLTTRVAEVLYLLGEVPFVPRTRENLAGFLVESIDDDLPTVLARIQPELDRLCAAKRATRIGDEYEFLTAERRSFEEEVANVEHGYRQDDKDRGLADFFVYGDKPHWRKWLASNVVSYQEREFDFSLVVDDSPVSGTRGDVTLKFHSPLSFGRVALADLESHSLRPDAKHTLFFLSGRVPTFVVDLARYLAVKEVARGWQQNPRKTAPEKELAMARETEDLPKLERKVIDGLKEGIRTGRLGFQGSSLPLTPRTGQVPGDWLRADMALIWNRIYPNFSRVPVRIANDQRAIQDALAGKASGTEITALGLYDSAGQLNQHAPLVDALRTFLAHKQAAGERVTG